MPVTNSIDAAKLRRIARLATDAAVTRYQEAEKKVIQDKNYPWSLFRQPAPSPVEVINSNHYKNNDLKTTQSKYKQFEDEYYQVLLALGRVQSSSDSSDDNIKRVLEDSARISIKAQYQYFVDHNTGVKPIYDDFYWGLYSALGQPYLNRLNTPTKIILAIAGLSILCGAMTLACSATAVPVSVVLLFAIVQDATALLSIILLAAERISIARESVNDKYKLPASITPDMNTPVASNPSPSAPSLSSLVSPPSQIFFNGKLRNVVTPHTVVNEHGDDNYASTGTNFSR